MLSSESFFLNWVVHYPMFYHTASSSLAYLSKIPLSYFSVASISSSGVLKGNEYLVQKLKRIVSAFIDISLL